MEKPTQEIVNAAAEAIWARGERASYESVRGMLQCRKAELVPYMRSVLNDPRQKRVENGEIRHSLEMLRQAAAAEQHALWMEQITEIAEENDALRANLASTEAELKISQARIADLKSQLATAKAETEVTRTVSQAQTAPLLSVVSSVIAQQTERAEIADLKLRLAEIESSMPKSPEIVPCTKWTAPKSSTGN